MRPETRARLETLAADPGDDRGAAFRGWLARQLLKLDCSTKALAKTAGISDSLVRRLLAPPNGPPTEATARILASAAGADPAAVAALTGQGDALPSAPPLKGARSQVEAIRMALEARHQRVTSASSAIFGRTDRGHLGKILAGTIPERIASDRIAAYFGWDPVRFWALRKPNPANVARGNHTVNVLGRKHMQRQAELALAAISAGYGSGSEARSEAARARAYRSHLSRSDTSYRRAARKAGRTRRRNRGGAWRTPEEQARNTEHLRSIAPIGARRRGDQLRSEAARSFQREQAAKARAVYVRIRNARKAGDEDLAKELERQTSKARAQRRRKGGRPSAVITYAERDAEIARRFYREGADAIALCGEFGIAVDEDVRGVKKPTMGFYEALRRGRSAAGVTQDERLARQEQAARGRPRKVRARGRPRNSN